MIEGGLDGVAAESVSLTSALGKDAEGLGTLLDEARVAFVHLRHAEAGCFIARVERVAI